VKRGIEVFLNVAVERGIFGTRKPRILMLDRKKDSIFDPYIWY
jgi:hypothetical protein